MTLTLCCALPVALALMMALDIFNNRTDAGEATP